MAQARMPADWPGERSSAGLGRKAADVARHAWIWYWTRRAEHAAVAILQALDDRSLKDIGLDRSEIESVVHGARPGERRVCRGLEQDCGAVGCC